MCMHLQCTSLVQMIWVLIIAGGQGSKSYNKDRQIQIDLLDAKHLVYFHSNVSNKYWLCCPRFRPHFFLTIYSLLTNPEFCIYWVRVLLLILMGSYLGVYFPLLALEQISKCFCKIKSNHCFKTLWITLPIHKKHRQTILHSYIK